MITLYTFGRYFGLPDGSPFVTKAMMLLKFAGLPYREDRGGYGKAPKGKLPFIEDEGVTVADSTFIRFHIETKYRFDFDAGLSAEQKAVAWSVEKMCEDHLYWAMIDARWIDDANFVEGPAHFFDPMPMLVRPFIRAVMRRRVAKCLRMHGLGRHTTAEIAELAIRDVAALAVLLGDKPYLMGDEPCGADASMFGIVAGILTPVFKTSIRTAAEGHSNLVAYRDRVMRRYFPDLAET
jgi:glutathione S-transferase